MRTVAFIDFENVQPDIAKIAACTSRTYVFYNASLATKLKKKMRPGGKAAPENVIPVLVTAKTKNAADFVLVRKLGELISCRDSDRYLILSKDKGFDAVAGYCPEHRCWVERRVEMPPGEAMPSDAPGVSEEQCANLGVILGKEPPQQRPRSVRALTNYAASRITAGDLAAAQLAVANLVYGGLVDVEGTRVAYHV